MAERKANVGLLVALAGGAALLMFGARGGAAPALPSTELVSNRIIVNVITRLGYTNRHVLYPHEIILLFKEYRTEEGVPLGTTRLWIVGDKVHVMEPFDEIKISLYAQDMVRVHVKPGWRTEPYAPIDTTEEVVPIWVNRAHVVAVQPTTVISHVQRGVLARLWFSNGDYIDVQLTVKQAIELFPEARQIPFKRDG
jgi:hypothetical protein